MNDSQEIKQLKIMKNKNGVKFTPNQNRRPFLAHHRRNAQSVPAKFQINIVEQTDN